MLYSPFEQFRERFISYLDGIEILISYGDIQILSECHNIISVISNLFERGFGVCMQFTAWYIILGSWFLLLELISIFVLAEPKNAVRFMAVYNWLKWQFHSILDSLWIFIGSNRRRKVAPFFFFTLFGLSAMNIFGMLPYSWSVTSQLLVTVCLGFVVWYAIVVEGLNQFGIQFFGLICPMTLPRPLIPLLIAIETISYIFRMISLALRLFANIVAGHVLFELFGLGAYHIIYGGAGFFYYTIVIILMMSVLLVALILFELLVSILQAYIFMVLCMIYMRDVYFLQGVFE